MSVGLMVQRLAHKIQAAVKFKFSFLSTSGQLGDLQSPDNMHNEYHPALLRAGLNNNMCDVAALFLVLRNKKIITEEEYEKARLQIYEAEVAGYEKWAKDNLGGANVTFDGLSS